MGQTMALFLLRCHERTWFIQSNFCISWFDRWTKFPSGSCREPWDKRWRVPWCTTDLTTCSVCAMECVMLHTVYRWAVVAVVAKGRVDGGGTARLFLHTWPSNTALHQKERSGHIKSWFDRWTKSPSGSCREPRDKRWRAPWCTTD